jgi:hypothetical protein
LCVSTSSKFIVFTDQIPLVKSHRHNVKSCYSQLPTPNACSKGRDYLEDFTMFLKSGCSSVSDIWGARC